MLEYLSEELSKGELVCLGLIIVIAVWDIVLIRQASVNYEEANMYDKEIDFNEE